MHFHEHAMNAKLENKPDSSKRKATTHESGFEAGAASGLPLFLRATFDRSNGQCTDDQHEQEAEGVARNVMRMPGPGAAGVPAIASGAAGLQRACACGGTCGTCQAQRTAPATTGDAFRSPGQPLDSETRAFMEPRFGRDFGQVRVHTDSSAAESAKAIQARAYTLGSDVAFAAGQFSPRTSQGKELLAHELTHTVQQRKGAPKIQRAPDDTPAAFQLPDVSLKEAEFFARQKGREAGARIRQNGGRVSPDDRGEIDALLKFFQGDAREVYREELNETAEKRDARISEFVQNTVDELDGDSRKKVLLSIVLNVNRYDPKNGLRQWALELKAMTHRNGSYLLFFFEELWGNEVFGESGGGELAERIVSELAKQGVMVKTLATEFELHQLLVEQQDAHMRTDIKKYPVYAWKEALGEKLEPIVEAVDLVIHLGVATLERRPTNAKSGT